MQNQINLDDLSIIQINFSSQFWRYSPFIDHMIKLNRTDIKVMSITLTSASSENKFAQNYCKSTLFYYPSIQFEHAD